jgi:hypothetical protein
MGSRDGWIEAGKGLIGIGQNYATYTNQNTTAMIERQAEEAKQQRLSRTDLMTTVNASADRALQRDKMEGDIQYRQDTLEATTEQNKATNLHNQNMLTATETAARATEKYRSETQAALAAKNKREHETLSADEKKKWENEAEKNKLADKRITTTVDMHNDDISLKKEAQKLAKQIADHKGKMDAGALKVAQDTVNEAKRNHNYLNTHNIEKLKILDNTQKGNVKIAEANIAIRKSEIKLLEKRINLEETDQKSREKLEADKQQLNDDIHEWNKTKETLIRDVTAAEVAYKKAQTATLVGKEERESFAGKWVFQTLSVQIGWDVNKATQVRTPIMGERLVAINVQNPKLMEIKILKQDGSWINGTPDGMKEHLVEAIGVINHFKNEIRKENSELSETDLTAAAFVKVRKLQPDYEWDVVESIYGKAGASTNTPGSTEALDISGTDAGALDTTGKEGASSSLTPVTPGATASGRDGWSVGYAPNMVPFKNPDGSVRYPILSLHPEGEPVNLDTDSKSSPEDRAKAAEIRKASEIALEVKTGNKEFDEATIHYRGGRPFKLPRHLNPVKGSKNLPDQKVRIGENQGRGAHADEMIASFEASGMTYDQALIEWARQYWAAQGIELSYDDYNNVLPLGSTSTTSAPTLPPKPTSANAAAAPAPAAVSGQITPKATNGIINGAAAVPAPAVAAPAKNWKLSEEEVRGLSPADRQAYFKLVYEKRSSGQ